MRDFIDIVEGLVTHLRTAANDNKYDPTDQPMTDADWDELDDLVASLGREREIMKKAGIIHNDAFGKGKRVKYVDRYAVVIASDARKVTLRYEDDGSTHIVRRRDFALKPGDSLF